jgi:hypothetical protein
MIEKRGITVIDVLSVSILKDVAKEYGQPHFDEFVEIAKESSIPQTFVGAFIEAQRSIERGASGMDSDAVFLELAARLFERQFMNPTPALYALLYAQGIGITKIWLGLNTVLADINNKEAQIQSKLQELHSTIIYTGDITQKEILKHAKIL